MFYKKKKYCLVDHIQYYWPSHKNFSYLTLGENDNLNNEVFTKYIDKCVSLGNMLWFLYLYAFWNSSQNICFQMRNLEKILHKHCNIYGTSI